MHTTKYIQACINSSGCGYKEEKTQKASCGWGFGRPATPVLSPRCSTVVSVDHFGLPGKHDISAHGVKCIRSQFLLKLCSSVCQSRSFWLHESWLRRRLEWQCQLGRAQRGSPIYLRRTCWSILLIFSSKQPITMRLSPLDFLESPVRLPPNNSLRNSSGHSPLNITLTKPVRASRSSSEDSWLLMRPIRCWGLMPSTRSCR